MCIQRDIKVMWGTAQKMLFSSGPSVDQAIIFSPDAPCKAIQDAVQPYEGVPETLADTV